MFTLLALSLTAFASPMLLTMDTGAEIRGELAMYQYGGDCQISVSEGPLSGAILIVPCARLQRFEREPSAAAVEVSYSDIADEPAPAAEIAAEIAAVPATPSIFEERLDSKPMALDALQEAEPTDALAAEQRSEALALPEETEELERAQARTGDIEGVPVDDHVSVDPALMDDRGNRDRAPAPTRTPTMRPPTNSATMGW